jgi:hypothetical protein
MIGAGFSFAAAQAAGANAPNAIPAPWAGPCLEFATAPYLWIRTLPICWAIWRSYYSLPGERMPGITNVGGFCGRLN